MADATTGIPGDILVIDDDPAIVAYVTDALSDEGYAIRGVYNGEEGLMEIHHRQPALVLLDVVLPGIQGAPLMSQIWNAAPMTPIVLMTAMPQLGEPLSAQYGLSWFEKPFSIDTLLTVVGRYVRLTSAGQRPA
jgi:DNA-binding response OmpR family regulator